jgi:hypothetical protein
MTCGSWIICWTRWRAPATIWIVREETADRLRCSPPEGIVEQALDMDILNERSEKPSEPDSEKTGRKLHTPTLGSLRVSGAPVDRLAQVDSALRGPQVEGDYC